LPSANSSDAAEQLPFGCQPARLVMAYPKSSSRLNGAL
jgi:hypothetical protein